MEKIKFWELTRFLTSKVEFDGNENNFRLRSDEFEWGAKSKREYEKAKKEIEAIEYSGKGWSIYARYDLSGFEYWMKRMKQQNYIGITISFNSNEILKSEIKKIDSCLFNALMKIEAISENYSYYPK